jgi:Endonuclease/Exonuclease/phosphatase family
MKKFLILFLFIFSFAGDLNLMFWNVENLFDVSDDLQKKDGDFLPGGIKRYTYRAYCLKVQHLADVINYSRPHLLAMVEVENHKSLEVLKQELNHRDQWEIIIDEGPDIRGIDPALIYRKDKFRYVSHEYFPVFISERGYHSRPLMRVDLGINERRDTLSIFINHWPSRRGGKLVSDAYRNYAASVLIKAVEKTLGEHPNYRLVMTGDFNDDRYDQCLDILCRHPSIDYLEKDCPKNVEGTYYHDGDWIHFDHFLISNFENAEIIVQNSCIIAPHWIRDKATNGPLRFYQGAKNLGGYSDHYPILLKLGFKRKRVE